MLTTYNLTLKIRRYDPDTGRSWILDYLLAAGRILRFVDLFRIINEEQDPTLTWSSSCEHGQCGSCSVIVNGKPLLACELLVENAVAYVGTKIFSIEPLDVAPVIRDLVVDLEKAYERIDKVKPFIIDPIPPPAEGDEYVIDPKLLERYVNATRCINCFCCVSACIAGQKNFLGPNAMLTTIVRMMDPREKEKKERLKILYSDQGLYRCHSSQACSFVCPKEINVAHFMALAKAGEFDPKSAARKKRHIGAKQLKRSRKN
jgi:succinate dehydrogenase / fumarate reductase iron-sulfur subunit